MIGIGNNAKINGPFSEEPPRLRIPYSRYARLIEVGGIATMLRNFPISCLRDDEVERFIELQNFFINLEAKCLDEAGVE